MPTAGLKMATPCINMFSGDATFRMTKVSFEQCYCEVWCVKDHYLVAVVKESIIHSLKGATADMARYMGPTTSIGHILHKLSFIFGTVASFDVLMQNFFSRRARGIMKRFPPLPEGWRGPSTNSTPVLWEDDRSRGPTTPQGLPLPWGEEAYLWLCQTPIQHPWHIIFPAHDSCPKGGEYSEETWDWVMVRATVTIKPLEGMAKLKH